MYLTRIDGHAAVVNRKAMELAVDRGDRGSCGRRIIRGAAREPTGVLIDRADSLVSSRVTPHHPSQLEARLLLEPTRSFAASVDDGCTTREPTARRWRRTAGVDAGG